MAWDIDIADVVAGQPITSSWGNTIRNRVVHVVASQAALPADIADGSVAYVTATGHLWWRVGGVWAQIGWREIRGSTAATLAAGSDVQSQPITFPAGLFTATPVGVCTAITTNNNVFAAIGSTSTTASNVRAVWRAAGQGPVSPLAVTLAWHFWQL
jgi:hypothetical protein